MTPNVTLHHFTAPQWFMEIGGWTQAENIHIFVEYAVKVGHCWWCLGAIGKSP
jgi:beta-glucosidase/6-phospho-beta-glucosidase/beta-galactosidase